MYNIAAENDVTAVTCLERHRVQYEAKGSNKTIFFALQATFQFFDN